MKGLRKCGVVIDSHKVEKLKELAAAEGFEFEIGPYGGGVSTATVTTTPDRFPEVTKLIKKLENFFKDGKRK